MTTRLWKILTVTTALFLGLSSLTAFAQPDPGNPPPPPTNQGGPGGGPGMGGPGPRGMGGPGMMMRGPRDAVGETLNLLGELNLTPDFTLDKDQKQRIAAIRDEFKKTMDKWRSDHEADFKKLQSQMEDLRDANPTPEDFQQINEARRKLMDTAPKGEEQAKQIQAVLTPDQLSVFTSKKEALDRQRKEMQSRMGGPGGPQNRPDNPPGNHPQNKGGQL